MYLADFIIRAVQQTKATYHRAINDEERKQNESSYTLCSVTVLATEESLRKTIKKFVRLIALQAMNCSTSTNSRDECIPFNYSV
jgi:hypothetical protein